MQRRGLKLSFQEDKVGGESRDRERRTEDSDEEEEEEFGEGGGGGGGGSHCRAHLGYSCDGDLPGLEFIPKKGQPPPSPPREAQITRHLTSNPVVDLPSNGYINIHKIIQRIHVRIKTSTYTTKGRA